MPRTANHRVELWITDEGDCDGYNLVGHDRDTYELVQLEVHQIHPPLDAHRALELASRRWELLFGVQLSLFPPYERPTA